MRTNPLRRAAALLFVLALAAAAVPASAAPSAPAAGSTPGLATASGPGPVTALVEAFTTWVAGLWPGTGAPVELRAASSELDPQRGSSLDPAGSAGTDATATSDDPTADPEGRGGLDPAG